MISATPARHLIQTFLSPFPKAWVVPPYLSIFLIRIWKPHLSIMVIWGLDSTIQNWG